jgi:aspartate carbamoyltransferase catalytic subunit
MVDIVITRSLTPSQLGVTDAACALINGGDAQGEHPTQALIDLLAIEEEAGAVESLRIGLAGDLRARAAHSLVKLLDRRPPASLVLMAPKNRLLPDGFLGAELASRTEDLDRLSLDGLDVLYMVGLPEGEGDDALPVDVRGAFALDLRSIRQLPSAAVVLSPMPVIDEIAPNVKNDSRVRIFAQSDRGVAVRMACIEFCLGFGSFAK